MTILNILNFLSIGMLLLIGMGSSNAQTLSDELPFHSKEARETLLVQSYSSRGLYGLNDFMDSEDELIQARYRTILTTLKVIRRLENDIKENDEKLIGIKKLIVNLFDKSEIESRKKVKAIFNDIELNISKIKVEVDKTINLFEGKVRKARSIEEKIELSTKLLKEISKEKISNEFRTSDWTYFYAANSFKLAFYGGYTLHVVRSSKSFNLRKTLAVGTILLVLGESMGEKFTSLRQSLAAESEAKKKNVEESISSYAALLYRNTELKEEVENAFSDTKTLLKNLELYTKESK